MSAEPLPARRDPGGRAAGARARGLGRGARGRGGGVAGGRTLRRGRGAGPRRPRTCAPGTPTRRTAARRWTASRSGRLIPPAPPSCCERARSRRSTRGSTSTRAGTPSSRWRSSTGSTRSPACPPPRARPARPARGRGRRGGRAGRRGRAEARTGRPRSRGRLRPRRGARATAAARRPDPHRRRGAAARSELAPGEIPDANSVMLSAMLREAGALPDALPIAPDRPAALADAVRAAAARTTWC